MDAKTMDNVTPLQLAIKHKVGAVVEALCKRGADMSVKDENNNCPLWVALDSGEEDIASTLVRYGSKYLINLCLISSLKNLPVFFQ